MTVQIRSELLKLTTAKSTWLLLAGLVAVSALLVGALAQLWLSLGSVPESAADAVVLYKAPLALGYLFPLVIGIVLVTHEYRSGSIAQTLLAEPRRHTVYLAKLAVGSGAAAVCSLAAVGAGTAAVAAVLAANGAATRLGSPEVTAALLGLAAALLLWGPIGVGTGAALRSTAAAVAAAFIVTMLLEYLAFPLLGMAGRADLMLYLPSAASDAAAGGAGGGHQLLGLLVLAGHAAALTAAGGWRFARHQG
ncbi:ABC transporter permease [Nocardiopsis sp. CNT-189]|uniref:ABC transporter permease n=1 Tax=Nocardiopsis oceanisediminis TaxID=2816862 RepID=UPI003B2DC33B